MTTNQFDTHGRMGVIQIIEKSVLDLSRVGQKAYRGLNWPVIPPPPKIGNNFFVLLHLLLSVL